MCCCNPTGGSGGAALAPLANALWLDKGGAAAGPGLPLVSGTQNAFLTVLAAVTAAPGPECEFFLTPGDYGAGGTAVDLSATLQVATFTASGGAPWKQADRTVITPLTGNGSTPVYLNNVEVAATEAGSSLLDIGSVYARSCLFDGTVVTGDPGVYVECAFVAGVTSSTQGPVVTACEFYICDVVQADPAVPINFSTPDARADAFTLATFGRGQVSRQDADPRWFVLGELTEYVVLRSADVTVNAAAWTVQGAWVADNTLTANRVLTVDMTFAPALAVFTVDNWDTLSGFTLTVNGTAVPGGSRVVFQNVAGVLTPALSSVLA